MSTFFIKPARIQVRDPITMKFLSPRGEEKPRSHYWLARLRDGDVVLASRVHIPARPVAIPTPAAPALGNSATESNPKKKVAKKRTSHKASKKVH